jgi:hypothetical protein
MVHLSGLSHAGIASRCNRTYVRQNGDSLTTQQDIYNGIAATRRRVCEGQNSIHTLASQLNREGFWSRRQFDEYGRVTAVLFVHPDSLTYLQAYPDMLLLDCTYKTNTHAMRLLDMIGVYACQLSVCIAFAFLSGEAEDDFKTFSILALIISASAVSLCQVYLIGESPLSCQHLLIPTVSGARVTPVKTALKRKLRPQQHFPLYHMLLPVLIFARSM